jgi:hypothetical protein
MSGKRSCPSLRAERSTPGRRLARGEHVGRSGPAWSRAVTSRSHRGGDPDQPQAALARTPPGSATSRPAETYSLSLLRRVRIEMPRILAAWVRLPRQ